jgi:hypothetical protein
VGSGVCFVAGIKFADELIRAKRDNLRHVIARRRAKPSDVAIWFLNCQIATSLRSSQ